MEALPWEKVPFFVVWETFPGFILVLLHYLVFFYSFITETETRTEFIDFLRDLATWDNLSTALGPLQPILEASLDLYVWFLSLLNTPIAYLVFVISFITETATRTEFINSLRDLATLDHLSTALERPLQPILEASLDLYVWSHTLLNTSLSYLEFSIDQVIWLLNGCNRMVTVSRDLVVNMEAKAEDLAAALKNSNLSIDAKLNYLLALKSDIKQKVVPAHLTPLLFHGIRLAITSQHSAIYAAGFSTLGHLLKRLYLQEQHGDVAYYARDLYPILLERLGDHKERVRTMASQAFIDLWPAAHAEVEQQVLGTALNGKNPKAKEMSMLWLVLMAKENGVLFRTHVPSLVTCLEDADSTIRETAKTTVIELFREAPSRAKLHLKQEMTERHVRKSIMNAILPLIGLDEEDPSQRPASRAEPLKQRQALVEERSLSKAGPRPVSRVEQRPVSRVEQRPVSRVEQRPVSRAEPLKQRQALVEEQSSSKAGHRPVSRVEQRPVSQVEQRPVSRVEQHPTLPVEQPPAQIQNPNPLIQHPQIQHPQPQNSQTERSPLLQALFDEIAAFDAEDEPVQQTASQQMPHIEQRHEISVQQDPISRMEEAPVVQVDNKPTYTQAASQRDDVPFPNNDEESDTPKVQEYIVHSGRELNGIFRDMTPYFEGRETEDNWLRRDQSITLLRRLTAGNAPQDFAHIYFPSIKSLLDGIFKVVNSLRTQLATNGCNFIQELSKGCGSRIDSMVETIMQNMLKICAGSKKITAGLGNTTVDILLQHVSYTSRLLQHIGASFDDKSMPLRLYASGWLKTLIKRQAHIKNTMEHNGGMDIMVKSIQKGLADANPGVREAMRSTFWAFARVWPTRSERLLSELDKKTRTLLEKDPANPRNETSASQAGPSQRGPGSSGPAAAKRSALKQAIAAQKKAHAQSARPLARPGSAHAVLSDPRPETAEPGPRSTLSSAPVRRGVRVTRPATAEPGHRIPISPPKSIPLNRSNDATRPKKLDLSNVRSTGTPDGEHRPRSDSPDRSRSRSPSKGSFPVPMTDAEEADKSEDISNVRSTDTPDGEHRLRSDSPDKSDPVPSVDLLAVDSAAEGREDSSLQSQSPGPCPVQTPERAESKDNATEQIVIYEDPDAVNTDRPSTLDADHDPGEVLAPSSMPNNGTELHGDNRPLDEDKAFPLTEEEMTLGDIRGEVLAPSSMPNNGTELHGDNRPLGEDKLFSLTEEEMTLGDIRVPTLGIRRLTHEGPLDENDPLTKRWRKVESIVAKRRNVDARQKNVHNARGMIATARGMIEEWSMDMYLYRKVQSLIAYHKDLFTDEEDYNGFLSLLLGELRREPLLTDDRKTRAALDLKVQVLQTIRFMFVYDENMYAEKHVEIMLSLMWVRQYFESRYYFITMLNEAADDLLYACNLPSLVPGVVLSLKRFPDQMPKLESVVMGEVFITKAMKIMNERGTVLEERSLREVGKFAIGCMLYGQPRVRRFVGDLCREIRGMTATESQFWEMLGWPTDQHARSLITYYLYKPA